MTKVAFDRFRDMSELIGGEELPLKRRRGRPRKGEEVNPPGTYARKKAKVFESQEHEEFSLSSRDVHHLVHGVSVQWLAKAFRLTRHVVQRKLGDLRPVGVGDYGNPLYSLHEAASCLVEPRIDMERFIADIKPDKLPEKLRESFWAAKLKQQRWEEKAGHLWSTETVMEVFGEVLMEIRTKLQQIPDRVERLTGLSIEQYRLIRAAVDEVQEEVYDNIVKFRERRRTPNQLGEAREEEIDDLI
jgi:hypothetical protein